MSYQSPSGSGQLPSMPPQPDTITRRYQNAAEFSRDMASMRQAGWRPGRQTGTSAYIEVAWHYGDAAPHAHQAPQPAYQSPYVAQTQALQPYQHPAPIPYQPPQPVQSAIAPPPSLQAYVMQAAPQPIYPVQTIVLIGQKSPNLLLRLIYFVCIGWWVSFIWSWIAWIFIDLIITMPLGLIMVNNLPFVATLKRQSSRFNVSVDGSVTTIRVTEKQQVPMIVRILFFLVVGWWFSGVWMLLAWLMGITLIGIPLAFWMYDRVPAVTTLRQY